MTKEIGAPPALDDAVKPAYDDGQVALYIGDALELMPAVLPARSVDLFVTDPPYVIGAVSAGSLGSKSGTWADMMNSAHWFTAWYAQARNALKDDGALWSFANWRTLPVVMRAAMDTRMPITSLAVWDKLWIGPGGSQGLRPRYEVVALMAQPEFQVPDRGVPDVWQVRMERRTTGHPAEKPEAVIEKVLSVSGKPEGALVVDPFAGSSTTGVVARRMGYRAILFEQDERFAEIAINRLSSEMF